MAVYDLEIKQGATFTRDIAWSADGAIVPLSTWSARMAVRPTFDAAPVLELTTANGRITLADADPNIHLEVSAAVTAALAEWGKGVWDLELVSPAGIVKRLLEGQAVLSREATQ